VPAERSTGFRSSAFCRSTGSASLSARCASLDSPSAADLSTGSVATRVCFTSAGTASSSFAEVSRACCSMRAASVWTREASAWIRDCASCCVRSIVWSSSSLFGPSACSSEPDDFASTPLTASPPVFTPRSMATPSWLAAEVPAERSTGFRSSAFCRSTGSASLSARCASLDSSSAAVLSTGLRSSAACLSTGRASCRLRCTCGATSSVSLRSISGPAACSLCSSSFGSRVFCVALRDESSVLCVALRDESSVLCVDCSVAPATVCNLD